MKREEGTHPAGWGSGRGRGWGTGASGTGRGGVVGFREPICPSNWGPLVEMNKRHTPVKKSDPLVRLFFCPHELENKR